MRTLEVHLKQKPHHQIITNLCCFMTIGFSVYFAAMSLCVHVDENNLNFTLLRSVAPTAKYTVSRVWCQHTRTDVMDRITSVVANSETISVIFNLYYHLYYSSELNLVSSWGSAVWR